MDTLDAYLNQIETLPAAPRALSQLMNLLGEDDVHADSVVELITYDPGLTAKVLQCCNSATMGLAQRVHNLPQAVACVGFNEIYRIVTAVALESTLAGAQPGYGIATGELWQHSVVTALAGRVLAQKLGSDENLVFTAGLLHDLGKLILSEALENAYGALMEETGPSGRSLLEAERLILGVEHAEIGGRILARWNFPEDLVGAVWHHHDPLQACPHEQLAACVYMGDMVAHSLGYGRGHQAFAVRDRSEVFDILGITAPEIESLILETAATLEESVWLKAPAS